MNATLMDISILGPAFLAGLLVLITHVPLGMKVLERGIVFIDLAIAQIAGIGVIAANLAGFEEQPYIVQLAAVSAALLGGLLLTYTEKRWPEVQEALIGVVFILAATGSVLLLAHDPHGGEHLRDLLIGQVLWVSAAQLVPAAVITTIVAVMWFVFQQRMGRAGFYLLFAIAVTVSVQLVGVYLVFASLIIPALATRYCAQRRLLTGYALGSGGYAIGLALSATFDLPAGAIVVWAMAMTGIFVYAIVGKRKPVYLRKFLTDLS